MLDTIRKLVGAQPKSAAEAPLQYIFSLNPKKRNLLLLDLKANLRLPDARLALPNMANLEHTVRRNRERIRIPYDAMLVLVKEMLSVRQRIPAASPLREIMTAIPGLVNTVLTQPLPTSLMMELRDTAIKVPGIPRAEQDAEVAHIRSMIAQKPQATPRSLATPPPLPNAASVYAASAYAAPVDRPNAIASGSLVGNSRSMSALDQCHFLERSVDLIESVALSTQELSDEDLAGYVDLCIMNGDHARVIDMLAERVAEQPRAWAWARLLELAEAAQDSRFAAFKKQFRRWAATHQPHLLPDLVADSDDALFHGLRKAQLHALEHGELGTQRSH